jgi:hypothetical protein
LRPATFTYAGRLFFVGALACFVAAAAFAADPKPDAALKNRVIDASVFLDDKIKADPALTADCLAEGKKWIDKNATEAAASRKQDPVMFRNGAWSFARNYTVRSVVDGHYVSIVRDDYMDTGGAHPNSNVDTILWTQPRRSASASGRSSRKPRTMVRP